MAQSSDAAAVVSMSIATQRMHGAHACRTGQQRRAAVMRYAALIQRLRETANFSQEQTSGRVQFALTPTMELAAVGTMPATRPVR